MFYNEFGATAGHDIPTGSNAANLALFTNVYAAPYWSGTAYAPSPSAAWEFDTNFGEQYISGKESHVWGAVAVRPGDVAAAVPEPLTYALLLAGLGVVAVAVRRRPR